MGPATRAGLRVLLLAGIASTGQKVGKRKGEKEKEKRRKRERERGRTKKVTRDRETESESPRDPSNV